MRREPLVAGLVALALVPAPAAAQEHHGGGEPEARAISIGYGAFDPAFVDVLAGDSVRWTNDSVRRHDVAAVDGTFDSGPIGARAMFSRAFPAAGEVAYLCKIHPFMRGTVAVHDLLLEAPREPAVPGRPYPLHGRGALPAGAAIAIEADEGAGFAPVATTAAREDGTFAAGLRLRGSAVLRAVSGATASPPVTLRVLDRTVRAAASTRGGRSVVRARVTPPGHGGSVVLQLRLRERFGWWPVDRARLDHHGRARFALRAPRRVRARVVLTLADGATPLAVSLPLRLGRG